LGANIRELIGQIKVAGSGVIIDEDMCYILQLVVCDKDNVGDSMKEHLNRVVLSIIAAASFAYCAPVLAGPSLLSAADQVKLSDWLGEGAIKLTNIYTKIAGDTSSNFHSAVDGKGRTVAVMQASNSLGQTWLVGGYNPQSWSSSGGFNMTIEQSQRTAFLFNLTDSKKYMQTPKTYALDTLGSYQTFNHAEFGPVFGIGNDLAVDRDMTHGLSLMYSYIDESGSNFYRSLLDNEPYIAPNVTYGGIEIYSISLVPEPTSFMLFFVGLGFFTLLRRRNS